MLLFKVSFATLISLVIAAPSSTSRYSIRDESTTLTIVNNCKKTIKLGQLENNLASNGVVKITPQKSKVYNFQGRWSGRFWAREHCHGSGCQIAGAAYPASLAEFTFHGDENKDYYDISFVDGYNLPLSIEPVHPESIDPNNRRWCGSPVCRKKPSCPPELSLRIDGVYIGCKSACSHFGNPEYCCSGEFGTPDKCPINRYASQVKSECPDAYSFAYDDDSSLYQCRSSSYILTWCP